MDQDTTAASELSRQRKNIPFLCSRIELCIVFHSFPDCLFGILIEDSGYVSNNAGTRQQTAKLERMMSVEFPI